MKPSEILEAVAAGSERDARQREIDNCCKYLRKQATWNPDLFGLTCFAEAWFSPEDVPDEVTNCITELTKEECTIK